MAVIGSRREPGAGHLGPGPEGLGTGNSVVGNGAVVAAKVEEVGELPPEPPSGGLTAAVCAGLACHGPASIAIGPAATLRPRSPGGVPVALDPQERQAVLDLLREPRFVDLAPAEVYATLLDEGVYHTGARKR